MKWLALIGMMVVLVGAAPPSTPAAGVLKFVDTTSDFDRIWNATKDLPDDKRVEAFEAAFAKVLPGFYEADRVKDYMDASRYRAFVLEGLKNYPRRRAGIQRVSRQFRSLVEPAQRQFEFVFGPMHGYPPIYLVNSFGEFDGGTRDLAEGNRLMFGADMIDEIYMDKPMKPFVEHELFHLMHHRTFPECDPAWCNLWEEGLATFVASKLNPGAPDAALGLTNSGATSSRRRRPPPRSDLRRSDGPQFQRPEGLWAALHGRRPATVQEPPASVWLLCRLDGGQRRREASHTQAVGRVGARASPSAG